MNNGNGKHRYTAELVVEAIKEAKGFISLASARLGCSRQTIYVYARKFATVREAIAEARAELVDVAEIKLFDKINSGDTTAIIFALKCLGKDRGYVERSEFVFNPPKPLSEMTDDELDSYEQSLPN